jgi:dTDP-4-amino-4,6-dideoxygalactose transaminase
MRMIANHGQAKKYYHSVIGVNSRLDSVQAAILNVKLPHLDEYCAARLAIAENYDRAFADLEDLQTPVREKNSTHVFHQYTLQVSGGKREALQAHLQEKGVPSMIYYPVPLYKQKAFKEYISSDFVLSVTEKLCESVLSLPIHTEMSDETQRFIVENVKKFFDGQS